MRYLITDTILEEDVFMPKNLGYECDRIGSCSMSMVRSSSSRH